ncbi:hypothetical protein AHAS_Ahas11G0187800 [Arachis hypogaea]
MVAGNITKKSQILSTPINGDMLQNHKMSKIISWDITQHHRMIHISILMHSIFHTPLIKRHHHWSVLSINSCKIFP